MQQTEKPQDLLEAHRHRRIRAFLAPGARTNDEELAFWAVVGEYRKGMDMQTAKRVVDELVRCERTVGELLDGWIPQTLQEAPDNEA